MTTKNICMPVEEREALVEIYKESDMLRNSYDKTLSQIKNGTIDIEEGVEKLEEIEVVSEKLRFGRIGASGIRQYIKRKRGEYEECIERLRVSKIDLKELLDEFETYLDTALSSWNYTKVQFNRNQIDGIKGLIDKADKFGIPFNAFKDRMKEKEAQMDFVEKKYQFLGKAETRNIPFISDNEGAYFNQRVLREVLPESLAFGRRIPLEGRPVYVGDEIICIFGQKGLDERYRVGIFDNAKVCHVDKDGKVRDIREGYELDLTYEPVRKNVYETYYNCVLGMAWFVVDEGSFNDRTHRVYPVRPGAEKYLSQYRLSDKTLDNLKKAKQYPNLVC